MPDETQQPKIEDNLFVHTIKEVTQPFKDLMHAPRALWGVNLSYIVEGLTYFGVVGLLAMYFNEYVGLNDINAGQMVGVLTSGITIAMLFLGATVDFIGVRKALLTSLGFMFAGRIMLSLAPQLSSSHGMFSTTFWISMSGILGILIGYGIYQPAAYTAVKKFTNEKTAAMGYAMLYALMNLGGFLPAIVSPPIRKTFGISGVFWMLSAMTLVGMIIVAVILTKKTVRDAIAANSTDEPKEEAKTEEKLPLSRRILDYAKRFPYKDYRFLFFIFILIPVQTLFAHNWLTFPQYCERAFTGLVSDNFEFFVNLNPIMIFVLTPMIAALTIKRNTYKMMIVGTIVMASAPFILVSGPTIWALFLYIIVLTVGEAMWQPRFLQWVAEIAPKDMTGIYMGLGQFPWFMTKFMTSLYSGWFLMNYCPADSLPDNINTESMWLIYGGIAMISPIALILARGWMMKGFKTKHEEK